MTRKDPPSLPDRLRSAVRASLRRGGRIRRARGAAVRRSALPVAYFLTLALVVLPPLLSPGYVLSLDMVFGPNADYVDYLFRTKGPMYYGRLPLLVLLDALSMAVADWVIQKLLLLALVTACGVGMYRAVPATSVTARLFAGTVYAVNPFVYVRLLAGHWYFLFGYALLPVAVVGIYAYLDPNRERSASLSRAVLPATAVAVFDPHAAVLLAIAAACVSVCLVRPAADRARETCERCVSLGIALAGLNAFWLLPALWALSTGGTHLAVIGAPDLTAFGTAGTVRGNVPLSVAMLYGFWRGGYRVPWDVVPLSAVVGAYTLLLVAATHGWYRRRDDPRVNGLLLAAVVGFVLGLGVEFAPTAPLFRALYEEVSLVRGMRDTQKFVALLALGYAYLGGLGVDDVISRVDAEGASPTWDGRPGRRSFVVSRRTLGGVVLCVAVLSLPLAYTFPMVGGFSGQLTSTEYPDEWGEANRYLAGDADEYRVLFLPWHQYMDFSWTDRTVANPSDLYFERPVVRGRNVEVGGIESQATDPTHVAVADLLREDEPTDVGGRLSALGIKYVVLTKEVDYRRYEFLHEQSDLRVVVENDGLVVFRNEAMTGQSGPGEWPADAPSVPRDALGVGAAVSLLSTLYLVRRHATTNAAASGTPGSERHGQ